MKLSELTKQIEDYIAENGDCEVGTLDYEPECCPVREPVLHIDIFGEKTIISL